MFMEEQELLDGCREIDLFCLHKVYLPRIQSSLDCFSDGWNHHQISTEGNESPFQLFTAGMVNKNFQEQAGVISYLDSDDRFGADIMGSSSEFLTDDHVMIDEIQVPEKVKQVVLSLNLDSNYGINHFITLKLEITNVC